MSDLQTTVVAPQFSGVSQWEPDGGRAGKYQMVPSACCFWKPVSNQLENEFIVPFSVNSKPQLPIC